MDSVRVEVRPSQIIEPVDDAYVCGVTHKFSSGEVGVLLQEIHAYVAAVGGERNHILQLGGRNPFSHDRNLLPAAKHDGGCDPIDDQSERSHPCEPRRGPCSFEKQTYCESGCSPQQNLGKSESKNSKDDAEDAAKEGVVEARDNEIE